MLGPEVSVHRVGINGLVVFAIVNEELLKGGFGRHVPSSDLASSSAQVAEALSLRFRLQWLGWDHP